MPVLKNRRQIALFLMGIFFCGAAARAQVPWTLWKAAPHTAGDWFDADNWTAGVPTADSLVGLVNGSEALIAGGEASARLVFLANSFGGYMAQTGGKLDIAETLSVYRGTYRIEGGQLAAFSLSLAPADTILILPDLTEVPLPDTVCQPQEAGICVPPVDVLAMESRFVMEGGVVDLAGDISVGTAMLEIIGGRLEAERLFMDGARWSAAAGNSTQSGGSVTIRHAFQIQDGTYHLSGGQLSTRQFVMGDPAGTVLNFANSRSPEFVQSGGTLTVSENLELCLPGFIIIDPIQPFTDVTFRLQAGNLNVGGDTIVGSLGAAPVRFFHSGGQNTIAGTMRIEGEESVYALSGGELRVGNLEVGTNVFNEGGTFDFRSSEARLTVDNQVTFGAEARLMTRDGAVMNLNGGKMEIQGNTADNLAGLARLTLQVEGGSEQSTLEAASKDLGAITDAWEHNFAIGTLDVGGNSTGYLQLVDATDNQTGIDVVEAVYVGRLIVGAGSTLDLSGLNLYYRYADIAGEVVASGGGMFAVIPEPASMVLILLAGLFSMLNKSRHLVGR